MGVNSYGREQTLMCAGQLDSPTARLQINARHKNPVHPFRLRPGQNFVSVCVEYSEHQVAVGIR